jgi:hypothetical protein
MLMRMWIVDPTIMCRNHLLGEHVEIHMFVGAIDRGQSVKGYLQKGLLEIHSLYTRHEELVKEMEHRGYNHLSDLDKRWKFANKSGYIDRRRNLEELVKRCPKCRRFFEKRGNKSCFLEYSR